MEIRQKVEENSGREAVLPASTVRIFPFFLFGIFPCSCLNYTYLFFYLFIRLLVAQWWFASSHSSPACKRWFWVGARMARAQFSPEWQAAEAIRGFLVDFQLAGGALSVAEKRKTRTSVSPSSSVCRSNILLGRELFAIRFDEASKLFSPFWWNKKWNGSFSQPMTRNRRKTYLFSVWKVTFSTLFITNISFNGIFLHLSKKVKSSLIKQ